MNIIKNTTLFIELIIFNINIIFVPYTPIIFCFFKNKNFHLLSFFKNNNNLSNNFLKDI